MRQRARHDRGHRDAARLLAQQDRLPDPQHVLQLGDAVLVVVVADPHVAHAHAAHFGRGAAALVVTGAQILLVLVARVFLERLGAAAVADVVGDVIALRTQRRDRLVVPELEVIAAAQAEFRRRVRHPAALGRQHQELQNRPLAHPAQLDVEQHPRLVRRLGAGELDALALQQQRDALLRLPLVALALDAHGLVHVRPGVGVLRHQRVGEPRVADLEPRVLLRDEVVEVLAFLLRLLLVLGAGRDELDDVLAAGKDPAQRRQDPLHGLEHAAVDDRRAPGRRRVDVLAEVQADRHLALGRELPLGVGAIGGGLGLVDGLQKSIGVWHQTIPRVSILSGFSRTSASALQASAIYRHASLPWLDQSCIGLGFGSSSRSFQPQR